MTKHSTPGTSTRDIFRTVLILLRCAFHKTSKLNIIWLLNIRTLCHTQVATMARPPNSSRRLFIAFAVTCLACPAAGSRPNVAVPRHAPAVYVCQSKACKKANAVATFDMLRAFAPAGVEVEESGCHGQCGSGPNLVAAGQLYSGGECLNSVASHTRTCASPLLRFVKFEAQKSSVPLRCLLPVRNDVYITKKKLLVIDKAQYFGALISTRRVCRPSDGSQTNAPLGAFSLRTHSYCGLVIAMQRSAFNT